MSETSEEHLQRLELATRAAELVPTAPRTEMDLIREGMAGEVPLRLALRRDGSLEVRATAPHPLPDGLEIQRDASEGLRVEALNPAMARRLSARAEVRQRLEALFEVAPQARVTDGAVLLELPPEVKGDPLQGALRAALRAASVLSDVSQQMTLAAERNREQVRSMAAPDELEGGRRFIKLLPSERPKEPESPEALSKKDERLGVITAILTLSLMAITLFVVYRQGLLDRSAGKMGVVIITFVTLFSVYPLAKGVEWVLDLLPSKKDHD